MERNTTRRYLTKERFSNFEHHIWSLYFDLIDHACYANQKISHSSQDVKTTLFKGEIPQCT